MSEWLKEHAWKAKRASDPDTTSAIEYKGALYIGSFSADGIGRVRVPAALDGR
jgi:hypothetical protein